MDGERISEEQRAYQRKIVEARGRAEHALEGAQLVCAAWFVHLMEEYHLQEGDMIDPETGVITRACTPHELPVMDAATDAPAE
jgi:hypothetical protein